MGKEKEEKSREKKGRNWGPNSHFWLPTVFRNICFV